MALPVCVGASSQRSTAAGSNSVAPGLPAGTVDGDLLFALVRMSHDFASEPAGWTLLESNGVGPAARLYWRRAGGTVSTTWTMTSNGGERKAIIAAWRYAQDPVDSDLVRWLSADDAIEIGAGLAAPTQDGMLAALWMAEAAIMPPDNARYTSGTGASSFAASDSDVSPSDSLVRSATLASSAAGRTAGASLLYLDNNPPNAPLVADQGVFNRNQTNRVSWEHADPDPWDDQQAAAELRYRESGVSAWLTVAINNPNEFWDSPSGTWVADLYEAQVRTADQEFWGPWSSSFYITAAASPDGPTITSPINGGTFAETQAVEWSTPAQDAYQIQVRDTADTVLYDTGQVTSETTRSATVPFPDNGTTRKLRLRVLDGGLWSPWYEITGTVSWLAPPDPVVSLLADDASGALAIAITNPAPTGEEPAAVYNDVEIAEVDNWGNILGWTRVATMVPINGIFTYWTPVSGRDYSDKVRVTAVAENGVTASTTTTTTTEPPVEGFYGGY